MIPNNMTEQEYYLMVETMLTCVKSVFLMGKDENNVKICDMLIDETKKRFNETMKKKEA